MQTHIFLCILSFVCCLLCQGISLSVKLGISKYSAPLAAAAIISLLTEYLFLKIYTCQRTAGTSSMMHRSTLN